jgi:ribosomal protein L3 glutamine methyltransferase
LKLHEVLDGVERRFKAARLHYGHGTENARDEAAFLVLRALRLPFDADLQGNVKTAELQRVERLVRKRIEDRIPVPYLLNEAWLDGRSFYVDRRVIVPRSHIAELLREKLKPWLTRSPRRILDLCTGSGCLAILSAYAFPKAQVDASDISPDALAVAKKNIARHRLTKRVRAVRSDLFSALAKERYDVIVTNPPYVTTSAMRKLPREYRYEPGLALAAGRTGLDLVDPILAGAPALLKPGGLLVCEVGDGRRAVERAYPGTGFTWPETAAGSGYVFILEAPFGA